MRVVDTSAWIEWLIGGPLHKTLRKEFPEKAKCVVPAIVQLELAKWLVREAGEDQADQAIAFTQKCVVAPLDTRIALSAADLHRQYKLARQGYRAFARHRRHDRQPAQLAQRRARRSGVLGGFSRHRCFRPGLGVCAGKTVFESAEILPSSPRKVQSSGGSPITSKLESRGS